MENIEIKKKRSAIEERIDQTGNGLVDMYTGATIPFYAGVALLTGAPMVALLFAGVGLLSKESLIKEPWNSGYEKIKTALGGPKKEKVKAAAKPAPKKPTRYGKIF